MKNSLIPQICLIIIGLVSLPVSAEPVKGLYETIIPVSDQGAGERSRAMRAGLAKVLVKVTGDSQVLAKTDRNTVLSKAERYVTEYGYVRHQSPFEQQDKPGLGMTISYAESSINRLLRQYQLQVWPSDRPEILVWTIVDDPMVGKSFASMDGQPLLLEAFSALMKDRGAPIILPLLDLQDQQSLSVESAWNFDQSVLATAAERYAVDTWLVLRLYQNSAGNWRGSSLFHTRDGNTLNNLAATDMGQLLGQVVPQTVDALASQYAYVPKDVSDELVFHIENINDYQTFNRAIGYLESLEVVDRLNVDYVDEDRLGLRLYLEGDVSLLLDTLNRDQRMIELAIIGSSVLETSPIVETRPEVPLTVNDSPVVDSLEDGAVPAPPVDSVAVTKPVVSQYRFRWGGK